MRTFTRKSQIHSHVLNQQVSRLYQHIIYIYTFSISVAHFIVAQILFKYAFFFIVTVRLNIFNF